MIDIFAWSARGPEFNSRGPTKTLQRLRFSTLARRLASRRWNYSIRRSTPGSVVRGTFWRRLRRAANRYLDPHYPPASHCDGQFSGPFHLGGIPIMPQAPAQVMTELYNFDEIVQLQPCNRSLPRISLKLERSVMTWLVLSTYSMSHWEKKRFGNVPVV